MVDDEMVDGAVEQETSEPAQDVTATDEPGTIIRDTDIVFDCPHCGHNLAIDYRGAGLQIDCVNCGESVLVPIPDGMKIDDLDLDPGEILKQLFASRRNLQKLEAHIEQLEQEVQMTSSQNQALREAIDALKNRLTEIQASWTKGAALQLKAHEEFAQVLETLSSEFEVETSPEDVQEEDAPDVGTDVP